MTNTVLLNNVDHAGLTVALGHSAAFGDAINHAVVFANEFDAVQRDYPILFRKGDDGRFGAIALLGLDRDENLFLDPPEWHGRYVPAVRQRGPFLIGVEQQGEPMIHVDLDHPRIGAADGAPLFLPHGGNAPYLEHVIRVLQLIHDGAQLAEPMFAAFTDADLIEPVLIEVKLDDHTQYNLPDFHTIGAKRLAALDGAALERLNRAGFLRAAFMVASSLANVSRLIELKNRKRRAL
jgi:hypothetical protein